MSRSRIRLTLAALLVGAGQLTAQVPADPVLSGRVMLDQVPLPGTMVVLHHVSNEAEGELDSLRATADGSFVFRLPNVPDPERSDVFFASVRHSGILYFGAAITLPVELDSTYLIQAYDTLSVEPGAAELTVQARNTFLESLEGEWRVTDLIQVRNDLPRTLVARSGGAVWRYPLAVGARNPTVGQGGLPADGISFDGDTLVVRAPIPPGERLLVVRYVVDDAFMEIPAPGSTEVMEVLIREPAPLLESALLTQSESLELEPGTTYRRMSGADLTDVIVRLDEGRAPVRFPVEWVAVVLALILTAFGVATVSRQAPGGPRTGTALSDSRESLILEIARMDAAFDALGDPGEEEALAYRRRRAELFRRLQALS
jgi:hypothetical protein